ncbi:MAG: Glu-tRNA(Gln) amidotransferase subunit GatE [Nanoarchaeota archaeon]|nr:Glu-tRNA(Gln) amidotransferase subunit GatE [Nanoarchaeota archaeon]
MNYDELEFKAGLEIHQQLDSYKLFCNCPSVLRKDEPDFSVKRKLHAVAGESGEIDVAALYQKSLDKEFEYQGYDSTCLIELDEEPPHEINKHALKIALHISFLLNCEIIPITQIMRKTVIDGSNTSGFQRTVLIARNGFIETEFGKVGIESIYLEEDAARIVERTDKKEIYKLDRLGIPLVEIVTAPDIKKPKQAKSVALQIGNLLRSCQVRRGIGTIRQDVNVSIRNENRVEIKGMQDMDIFVKVIEGEVLRQKQLSYSGKQTEMEVRNAQKDGSTKFMRPLPGSSRMYPETDLPLLYISRDFINSAKKTLPKLQKDIEEDLKREGLDQEMIKLLFKQNKLELFKELLNLVNNPKLIAKIILIYPKEISKHLEIDLDEVEAKLEDGFSDVLYKLGKKKISEDQIKLALEKIVKGEGIEFEQVDSNVVEEKVQALIKEKPGLSEKAYMGLLMKEFKGKIGGKEAVEIIRKLLG